MRLILLLAAFFGCLSMTQAQDVLRDDFTMKLTKTARNKKYGYKEKQAVKLGGFHQGGVKAHAYFHALKGPQGQPIQYERLGSCCMFKTPNALIGDKGLLDRYEVTYEGLKKPVIIYINEYDYAPPLCPKGFTFKTNEEVDLPQEDIEEPVKKA